MSLTVFLHNHVVDFIHVHYADVWHYPIFNIADIGICVGMAMIIYDMLFLEKNGDLFKPPISHRSSKWSKHSIKMSRFLTILP